MTVKTDPVLEAIAKKLHGIESVPPAEQAKMIRRAAKAGADELRLNLPHELVEAWENYKVYHNARHSHWVDKADELIAVVRKIVEGE